MREWKIKRDWERHRLRESVCVCVRESERGWGVGETVLARLKLNIKRNCWVNNIVPHLHQRTVLSNVTIEIVDENLKSKKTVLTLLFEKRFVKKVSLRCLNIKLANLKRSGQSTSASKRFCSYNPSRHAIELSIEDVQNFGSLKGLPHTSNIFLAIIW